MAKKRAAPKRVTSAEINAFITANAAETATLPALADRIDLALGVRLSREAVRQRCLNMRVKTQGVRPTGNRGSFEAAPAVVAPLDKALAKLLLKSKSGLSLERAADELDVSPRRLRDALDSLKAQGHRNVALVGDAIELAREIPKAPPFRIDVAKLAGRTVRFGVTGDNHLGSKYERMDVLNALFDTWAAEGIQSVYQLGNMIEGEARFNKFDIHTYGMDAQCEYFAEQWPRRKGMTTYYVTGDDHEGWYVQREGVNIGRYLEDTARKAGRSDLVYLGHMEHDIVFEGRKQSVVMRLIHAGGGSSYATSYSAQKIVESYQGGEKPQVLLIGHYHKAEYGYPREVHCLQVGCTQDQSPFMRKKKLQAHVGGWTVEMTINPDGLLTRFRTQWMPFYDRGFYGKAWAYQGTQKRAA